MSQEKEKLPRIVPKITPDQMIPPSGLPGNSASSQDADPQLRESPAEIDSNAHKFDLASLSKRVNTDSVPAYEHLGELPSSYGTRKLYLTARDPHWLFSYWDLSFDQISEAERQAHDSKVFLQIYLDDGSRVQQIQITAWSKEWMIHTNRPNTRFYAEIGYYRYDGSFEVLTRSNHAQSPRDNLSENTEVKFATIPFKISFAELHELLDQLAQKGEGLAETLARLQGEGYPLPFDYQTGERLSEEERKQFIGIMEDSFSKRIWIDSQEIVERFTKRYQPEGEQTWPPSSHWLAGSSMSSPFCGKSCGFNMHVNAELIIYGGSEPNATMRIDGKDVALDENGNFHFHFNFQEGKYHIPIEATSADKRETKNALLSFLRITETSGGVQTTSQPERDSPMGKID